MIQLIMRPELHRFDTCKEFAEAFSLGTEDLVLTNRYIYEPYFGPLGLKVHTLFQEAYGTGEPSDVMVERILEEVSKIGNFRRIIAIGGGTVIDIAKVLAVAGAEKRLDVLYDKMPQLEKSHELILLPTTCGTGSEMTNIAVIHRTRLGTKMGLVAPTMYADQAVLIPELLQSLPYDAFATSSLDALVHAVESALSPKATIYTRVFSYRAIELIIRGYQTIATRGRETLPGLLEDFLVAANFAGVAFGTAGCAAVHAMSYPLGGEYHVAHGESNYAMFTGVLKNYVVLRQDGEIGEMGRCLAGMLNCGSSEVYDELDRLLEQIFPRKALRQYGVPREKLPEFADSVIRNQGRLMANSFVPLDRNQVLKIYQELY